MHYVTAAVMHNPLIDGITKCSKKNILNGQKHKNIPANILNKNTSIVTVFSTERK